MLSGSCPRHRPRLVLNRRKINQSVRPRIVTPNTRMGLVVAMILYVCVCVCGAVRVGISVVGSGSTRIYDVATPAFSVIRIS